MTPTCYLVRREHIPEKARFPVIDAHNHLWNAWDRLGEYVRVMEEVGVVGYADLTANLDVRWVPGGYRFEPSDIRHFFERAASVYAGRFYGFTTATFNRPADRPLYDDLGAFVAETVDTLRAHARRGARGLKVLKELGLRYRGADGRLVRPDEEWLAPIWDEAACLGLPVLIHVADPYGFFEPLTPDNEHAETLKKYPDWSFARAGFPRFMDLQNAAQALVRRHPRTRFILAHVANFPENLAYVGRLLDDCPNVFIDLSARLDELGRQPHAARAFMIRYRDRVLFGTDMPPTADMYRCHFRFLETRDDYFMPPDYDGTFGRCRWFIHGMGLPDEVLQDLYYRNALRLVPGLAEDMRSRGIVFP